MFVSSRAQNPPFTGGTYSPASTSNPPYVAITYRPAANAVTLETSSVPFSVRLLLTTSTSRPEDPISHSHRAPAPIVTLPATVSVPVELPGATDPFTVTVPLLPMPICNVPLPPSVPYTVNAPPMSTEPAPVPSRSMRSVAFVGTVTPNPALNARFRLSRAARTTVPVLATSQLVTATVRATWPVAVDERPILPPRGPRYRLRAVRLEASLDRIVPPARRRPVLPMSPPRSNVPPSTRIVPAWPLPVGALRARYVHVPPPVFASTAFAAAACSRATAPV